MLKILLLLLTTTAYSATSGSLLLRGTVPEILDIVVNSEAISTALPLDTTQVDTLVGTVDIESNAVNGYVISISSLNNGKLVHETNNSYFVNYSLKYDNVAVNLAVVDQFTDTSSPVDVSKNLNISYTGIPHTDLIEGDYEDTLTITISAN